MPLLGVLASLHGNVSPRLLHLVDLLMHVLARYADDCRMYKMLTFISSTVAEPGPDQAAAAIFTTLEHVLAHTSSLLLSVLCICLPAGWSVQLSASASDCTVKYYAACLLRCVHVQLPRRGGAWIVCRQKRHRAAVGL
jgi:hypothetical protein